MMFMVSAENDDDLPRARVVLDQPLRACAIDIELETSLESGLKYRSWGASARDPALRLRARLRLDGAIEPGAIGEAGRALEGDAMLVVGLAMVLTGLGFKASAAPFHMDARRVPGLADTGDRVHVRSDQGDRARRHAARAEHRVPAQDDLWMGAVAAIAVASLAIGNLAALVQRNVKRMLAYSSISHAGFMLIPVAAANELGGKALLYYLVPYGAASLGAFAVVAARERELGQPVTLDNLSGMGWERPFLGFALALFAFAFIGLPPRALHGRKLYAFSAAVEADMTWLVIVGVVATAVSVYYYLAIVRSLYMRAELQLAPVGGAPPRELLLSSSIALSLGVVFASFILVQPLIDLAEKAITPPL